jgi:nitrous oxide reductase accessory protein NosL
MKAIKILLAGLVVASSLVVLNADKLMQLFQSVAPSKATLVQSGKEKKFCPVCGMNLPMFYKTNYAANVNGKEKQYCSLHCLVEDEELNHADVKNIKAVDAISLKFIDAKKAYYVVGSKKKGTMSMVSKYAFKNLSDAAKFAKANGGTVMDFNAAYSEAKKDFANDARMIAKKQKMMAKKGAMIYNKMCQKTDKKFSSVAEAKAFIIENKLCNNLNGKQLQAVGLYLNKR